MDEYERKKLEDFFIAIQANLPGYREANFSYVAFKKDNAFQLAQGRLQLQSVPASIASGFFQSENVKAGIYRLTELNLTPRRFIESLFSGKIQTPHGDLLFPPEIDRYHSLCVNSHHREAIAAQRREIRLSITGEKRQSLESPLVDWELKSAPTPYFNFQELCDEFFVGPLGGDFANVEIIASNIAAVATESSIDGTKARLVLILAEGLEPEKAAMGYRVFERNRVAKRGQITGSALQWNKVNNVQRGVGEIEVPPGAVIDCVASYAGVAQQHYWVADPKTAQNPLRSVHHAFDSNLEVLQELIRKAQTRGANARDLEIAVSWLLWMLGFSVTHIGGTPKTSDAPDLVAATPAGDFVVIECTTGILKEDSKLSHLCQRAEKVRQSLALSGNQHLKVLPIIITTKTREEVKSEIEQANKLGVLVATREDFPELFARTMLFPDANRHFAEAEQTLRRLQNPPVLPGLGV